MTFEIEKFKRVDRTEVKRNFRVATRRETGLECRNDSDMTCRLPFFRKFLFLTVLTSVLASTTFAIGFDLTFASSGKFMTSFADSGQPSSGGSAVFIQPSGRIVVVGSHSQQGTTGRTTGIAIAGLTHGGSLDPTYGTGGKILTWSPTFHRFPTKSLALGDGSILVFHQMWESASANRPAA